MHMFDLPFSIPWRPTILTLVILLLLPFDIIVLTVLQPLPTLENTSSSWISCVFRVLAEILAYASLGFVALYQVGWRLGLTGLLWSMRHTSFHWEVVMQLDDFRFSALFNDDGRTWNPVTTILVCAASTMQGLLCILALRSPAYESARHAFLVSLGTHFKYLGLAFGAVVLVPLCGLALLLSSIALLHLHGTREEYRLFFGTAIRIIQRVFFGVLIYLIFLETALWVFDAHSLIYDLSEYQIHFLAPFSTALGCISLFCTIHLILCDQLVTWIERLKEPLASEKHISHGQQPFFVQAISFSLLPITMTIVGIVCSYLGGPKVQSLLPALLYTTTVIFLAILLFLLDLFCCWFILLWKDTSYASIPTEHTYSRYHDEHHEEGTLNLLEAGEITPQIILTPPPRKGSNAAMYYGNTQQNEKEDSDDDDDDADERFFLGDGDEDDGDEDREDQPLIP